MDISPLLPGPLTPASDREGATANARNAASADFDTFLTLLTAQLRNQDPMSPLDSTDFIAQLASFSSVEQAVGTNERLDALTQQSLGADLASFASWIGHDVVLADGTFRPTGGEVAFTAPSVPLADSIRADIVTSDGRLLRQMIVAPDANGHATWDGLDGQGRTVTGTDATITLSYFQAGELLEEQPARVARRVSGLQGSQDGLLLELADGGFATPETVARLVTTSPGT